MTHSKSTPSAPLPFSRHLPAPTDLADDTVLLLELASQLGPRDTSALAAIIRRAAEMSETDGEEVALAVLDQIEGILRGRVPSA